MISSPSGVVINGGTFNAISQTKRGFDLLLEWVATDAFHDSKELYDAPKCHPHTRLAVLDDIMKWVEAQDDFMMWLFGPAGAGKSAIAKKIAELAAEKGLLVATFFFSRASPTRSTQDRLIATLAYQLALSIPGTRTYIEDAIERDPAIFHKNIQTQIDILLIKPFQSVPTIIPSPKLIIIDGLDECNNSKAQVSILDAISRSFPKSKLPMIFLVVSRPETDIVCSFNGNDPLKYIHRRLALDDTYHPDDDIRLFFSDKFEQIQCTHRLRSTIPMHWPTEESLKTLVNKSSGQFIFAATVVRFVESNCHRPATRLNIILGISPPGTLNPFTELDALYKQILSGAGDIQLTLRVLSLYIAAPRHLATDLHKISSMSIAQFLSLEEGDIDIVLINLSSVVSYNEPSGEVEILHASLVDFLSDKRRSNEFYIDIATTRTDFACRTLQYVKGPDGIRAGDLNVFETGIGFEGGWILNSQIRNDILNFDFDAFITAMIKYQYKEPRDHFTRHLVIRAIYTWMHTLTRMSLQEKGDKQLEEAISRCYNSFESRIQKYQSDWRLQLLLTLAVVTYQHSYWIPECRYLDILLEMDDHDLHLVDQDTLDLRHNEGLLTGLVTPYSKMIDIISRYIDGDRYASAALHCMCFLSNPPKYFGSNNSPEMGVIYAEWKATCNMTLEVLCGLLKRANTSPELIQFISDHDIDPAVRKHFSAFDVWPVDAHILAFLSRADVCVNWRIISAIRHDAFTADQPPEENDAKPDNQEEMGKMIRQHLDQCCSNVFHHVGYNL